MLIPHNYRFNKRERLNSEKKISQLFDKGYSSSSGSIRMVYLQFTDEHVNNVEVMFSVSKRNYKNATDRNLIKRRMREAYRLHKPRIQKNILVAFIYIDKKTCTFATIEQHLVSLINKLEKQYV